MVTFFRGGGAAPDSGAGGRTLIQRRPICRVRSGMRALADESIAGRREDMVDVEWDGWFQAFE